MATETQRTAHSSSPELRTPRQFLSTLPTEIRRQIIYNVLCPPKTCYTYRGFGLVYIIRFGGADFLNNDYTANPITICEGLPTIFAVSRQLQSEAADLLYSDVEIYFENAGPPVPSDPAALPEDWQPPRNRILDFFRFRNVTTVATLHPACPTQSTFEPALRSAQMQGLRTTEHAWIMDTLAKLLSPPHTFLPLKSLRFEVYITWDMMDTVESVKGFEKIVHGLIRLRGIRTIDFKVKDKTNKGKDAVTTAHFYIHSWLEYVRRIIDGGEMVPEIHMFDGIQVVVGFGDRPQKKRRGAVDSYAPQGQGTQRSRPRRGAAVDADLIGELLRNMR